MQQKLLHFPLQALSILPHSRTLYVGASQLARLQALNSNKQAKRGEATSKQGHNSLYTETAMEEQGGNAASSQSPKLRSKDDRSTPTALDLEATGETSKVLCWHLVSQLSSGITG